MDQSTLIKAKWLLPVVFPPIRDGYLIIKNGKITKIGKISHLKKKDFQKTIDFSQHIVMPGLINPHTHLELSNLKGKIKRDTSFTQWIRGLTNEILSFGEEDYKSSINSGIDELILSGVTAVGDISRTGLSYKILEKRGLRGMVFLEVLGFHPSIEKERIDFLNNLIMPLDRDKRVNFGVSPHAPYSVSPDLFKESYHIALKNRVPISIHCSETEEELEFLEKGRGEIRRMLEDFGLWDNHWTPPLISPIAYLDRIGVLKNIIGIHINLLRDGDLDLLKRGHVKVVCCLGSNQWFNRKKICPVDFLLKEGISVSLGTDSLASNSGLNLFDEMRLAKKIFGALSYQKIIEMATIEGAKTLSLDKKIGSFEKDKEADMVSIELRSNDINDPNEYIVNHAKKIDFMMIGGKEIFSLKYDF
jgi:cytosine/adenosine deaminase-related metal-dependent hydrolase